VLVDRERGRHRTWTRIRVNLQHVPEALRPQQEPLDRDDVVNEWEGADANRGTAAPTRGRKRRSPS
jgi:hypothetical protein